MAEARKSTMPLLLGVPDRQVNENESTTWETNKIGGTPDWFQPKSMPMACCGLCQREMTLVTQIYCPLTSSPFHRCLHIFVCPAKQCSLQNNGWRVIRTQMLDETSTQQSKVDAAEDEWMMDEHDDWGVGQDDWDDDDDEDCSQTSQEMMAEKLSEMTLHSHVHQANTNGVTDSCQKLSAHESCCGPKGDTPLPPHNGGDNQEQILKDSASSGPSPKEAESSEQVEAEAVTVDNEGLNRMLGLLAASGGSAGARSQGDENDHKMMGPVSREAFRAYYLDVFAEADLEEGVSDHVDALLRDYQQREGQQFAALLSHTGKDQVAAGGVESYDKTEVKHGDRQCYKFIKRMQLCPQQCVRYQWKGSPLLMSKTSGSPRAARCERCQASRMFELQLVPPLIPLLKFPSQAEPQVEFGTVLVFTCSDSCWSDGETYREEVVLLQHDPDRHLFR